MHYLVGWVVEDGYRVRGDNSLFHKQQLQGFADARCEPLLETAQRPLVSRSESTTTTLVRSIPATYLRTPHNLA